MLNELSFKVNIVPTQISMNMKLDQVILKFIKKNKYRAKFFDTEKSNEKILPLPCSKMHYNVAIIKIGLLYQ